jgi:hypothetical protein
MPLKQADAQFVLELPDAASERWLSHPKKLRRCAQAAMVSYSDYVANLVQFHGDHKSVGSGTILPSFVIARSGLHFGNVRTFFDACQQWLQRIFPGPDFYWSGDGFKRKV